MSPRSDSSLRGRRLSAALALALSVVAGGNVHAAGKADVIAAKATRSADGRYRFDVTIRSADTGWDAYADAFEVLSPGGKVLGTRELAHPHEDEQPFTRELDGVTIPRGTTHVVIRARFKPGGYDGATFRLELPK